MKNLDTQMKPLILLVDDKEEVRMLQKKFLKNQKCDIIEAQDGNEAIEIAQKEKPDLVILDINLPDIDGIAVCKKIKTLETDKNIIVLISTSERKSNDEIAIGYDAGAEGYILFPYSEREFLARVKTLLRLVEYERELVQSATDYKNIFNQSHDAIIVFEPENELILEANQKAVEVYGYPREKLIGRSLKKLSVNIKEGEKKVKETLENGFFSGFITIQRNNKGEELHFEVNAKVINYQGKTAILSHNHNITMTKKLEHENELIKFSIENADASVFWISPEGQFFYVNKTAAKALGYEDESLTGRYIWDIDPEPDHQIKTRKKRWEDLKKKKSGIFETKHKTRSGRLIPVRVTTRYFIFQGREYEFAFAQDISKEKAAEEQLRNYSENLENIISERTSEVEKQAKKLGDSQKALTYLLEDVNDSRDELKNAVDELEAVNKELESFSYSVSHDLRAPLTRMDGFSKVLLEKYSDVLDVDGKHYLKRIRASSQIMAQLINELLTLSRITRRELKREEVDISKIANIIINDIKKSDPEQKIKFEVQEGLIVMGDKTLLTFMLENLLSNAFKFTFKKDKGTISLGNAVIDNKEVIFVKDTGVGFNMKYYNKLFVAFQRLHSDKDYEGTGIGLATVLRIVNRHGGKIWAESEINIGTTFYFTL